MKIALIGYGKMGRMVEHAAIQKEHEVVARIGPKQQDTQINAKTVGNAEICIDFSHPAVVVDNIKQAALLGKSLVVGTTGWEDQLSIVQEIVSKHKIALIYSPNFSLGVALFLKIVKEAAELINPYDQYDVGGYEIHHRRKEDSPSGTAKATLDLLLKTIKRKKTGVINRPEKPLASDEIHFSSLRCGEIPGTHCVLFDSAFDTIEIKHTARSREGFAYGAIAAAEWLQGKTGFFTLEDMLNFI
jgi:4-hydroxy-tetrahydrodipicolinate reductase